MDKGPGLKNGHRVGTSPRTFSSPYLFFSTYLFFSKASVPDETVSESPKVRAMEIIDSLEPPHRGPYAGAVGYIDYRGN